MEKKTKNFIEDLTPINDLREKLSKLTEQSERYRKALEKISEDFNTDACDGKSMLAREALK